VRIDHLIYAAPDLTTAVADVEDRFGVRAQAGGKHDGLGTHNALLALGPLTYLEIIAPDPEQPRPVRPVPFGVDRVTSGGLVGWALACDDIDGTVAKARSHGYDPGDVIDGQRVRPAGTVLRWRATSNPPADTVVPVPHLLGRHRASGQNGTIWAHPGVRPGRTPRSPISCANAHRPRCRRRGQGSDGSCARGPPGRPERQHDAAMMPSLAP